MIAGHLQVKRGIYQIVLNYTDSMGNRKTKWKSTGLPVKGNKTRAEAMLQEARRTFVKPQSDKNYVLFADYMEFWLDEVVKPNIKAVTYAGYCYNIKNIIAPYFRKTAVELCELNHKHIQDFYTEQLKRVKATTVIRYHANMRKALKYAVKMDLIPSNPADSAERPRKDVFVGNFLDVSECDALYRTAKGTKLEMAVIMGVVYGMRRSEVTGLKWSAVDFKNNTISINHTASEFRMDGEMHLILADTTKTMASHRTLPLIPQVKTWLMQLKERREENRRLCGRSYCKDYPDYIYVDDLGYLVRPSYISQEFGRFLKENGFRPIRFHDLRHTCASLLLEAGVPMKAIQEWLGHSDFTTTANVYAHLDYSSKISAANALIKNLGMEQIIEEPEKTVAPAFRGFLSELEGEQIPSV